MTPLTRLIQSPIQGSVALALCLLLPVPLPAVEEEMPQAEVKLSAITLDTSIRDLKFVNRGRVEALHVNRGLRSEPIRYVGSPEILFFRETPPPPGETEPGRDIVGRLQLPALTGDFLMIFRKNVGPDAEYTVAALPDDKESFKPGMYRFINLTPYDIALKVGATRKMIPKRGYTDVSSQGKEGEYQETLIYSLSSQVNDGDPYRAFKGSLFFSETMRSIYLLVPASSGRPGSIEFTVIPEKLKP